MVWYNGTRQNVALNPCLLFTVIGLIKTPKGDEHDAIATLIRSRTGGHGHSHGHGCWTALHCTARHVLQLIELRWVSPSMYILHDAHQGVRCVSG